MYGDSIFKVIINSIKNFFKILVTLVASAVTSIFGIEQKEVKINNKQKNLCQFGRRFFYWNFNMHFKAPFL